MSGYNVCPECGSSLGADDAPPNALCPSCDERERAEWEDAEYEKMRDYHDSLKEPWWADPEAMTD